MNKKKLALLATAVFGAVGLYGISILGSEGALFERFPDVPKDVVVKAHRKMVARSLRGEYNNLDTSDDAVLDKIFLDIVKDLTK